MLKREIKGYPSGWLMGDWLGVPEAQVAELIKNFNKEWEFGCLPPLAGSVEVLRNLHSNQFRFAAITCCDIDSTTKALRKANLYHVFGSIFSEVICLPLGHDKTPALELYDQENVVAWIEDKPEAAMAGKKLGFDTFLMRASHNRKYENENPDHFRYVNNWSEIEDHLLR
jgi:phosphoglycolate phosphatase-like HAD superfamily hydrolase